MTHGRRYTPRPWLTMRVGDRVLEVVPQRGGWVALRLDSLEVLRLTRAEAFTFDGLLHRGLRHGRD